MKLVELMISENIATHQDVQAFVSQLNDPRLKLATKDGFPTHIRTTQKGGQGLTKAQAEKLLGMPLKTEVGITTRISNTYSTHSFLHNGKTYYIVTLNSAVNPSVPSITRSSIFAVAQDSSIIR